MTFRDAAVRFLLAPASPRPLALFRIGIAALELALAAVIYPYLLQLYGQYGFVQWPVGELIVFPWLPTVGRLASLLAPLGISASAYVRGLHAVYVLSLLGLLLGWRTRILAVAAWLLHLTLMNSGFFSTYGVDLLVHIALFYCAWMPVGACLSLDRRAGRASDAPTPLARLSLRALQIHLCIVYLTAGLSKAAGAEWWNGEAIWLSVMQPQFRQLPLAWLSEVPWVPMAAGWAVMVVELGYAFFIWRPETRGAWLGATLALHLGIGLFLGLWFFAAVMVVFNLAALAAAWRYAEEGTAAPPGAP
ncbi:MAG TPA: HTTM domain-containing protein [Vicinamibacteria bacterium]